MWQRFTLRAQRVVFFAQEEATHLGKAYVSTVHLLLGLVRENDTVASTVLDRLGTSSGRVRSEVERYVTRGNAHPGQEMQLTSRAKRVFDIAYDEARLLGNTYIGTEHLLLGLIRDGEVSTESTPKSPFLHFFNRTQDEFGEGFAGSILRSVGVELERTRREIAAMQQEMD